MIVSIKLDEKHSTAAKRGIAFFYARFISSISLQRQNRHSFFYVYVLRKRLSTQLAVMGNDLERAPKLKKQYMFICIYIYRIQKIDTYMYRRYMFYIGRNENSFSTCAFSFAV